MTDSLAPIVLFTFNRPWHTQQVLDALAKNKEAKESVLYVYCDGIKPNSTEESLINIEKVRNVVNAEKRFKKLVVSVSEKNKGLANSIIEGVTEVINRHGKVIVLEDDILVSKGFLKYMNDALSLYSNSDDVGCIHAWNYHLETKDYKETTFFLRGADCWGWATWKRAWDLFESDGKKLLEELENKKQEYSFNRNGTHPFIQMLKDQIADKNDSWAIRWHASLLLQNKYCLHPTKPIVKNIGLDNSGTHSGSSFMVQKPVDYILINKINVQDSDWFYDSYRSYVKNGNKHSTFKVKIKEIIKTIIKLISPPIFIVIFKKLFFKNTLLIKEAKQEVWSGEYNSWDEAKKKCIGYDSTIILEKCKNALLKVKKGEAVYERDSVLFDEIQYSWGLLAGIQKAALENEGKVCILDFGGSLGSTYYQNKEFLSGLKKFEWCIVEQRHFVDCGRQNFENEELKFYYTIEECLEKHQPNVLLLSSVLQYLENPYEWLEKFVSLKIPYIIIDRTAFVKSEKDILTLQNVPESIYRASYPSWFFNENNIKRKFVIYQEFVDFKSFCDGDIILNCTLNAYWKGFIYKIKQ